MKTPSTIVIHTPLILLIAVADWLWRQYGPTPEPSAVVVHTAWLNFVIQIAIMIVSSLISAALAPKPKPPKPASITDFELPTAEEGREIPVVFGEVWITGPNVLWYGDLTSKPIKKKAKKK